MKIKIQPLSSFSADDQEIFINKIASWHYEEWGKYQKDSNAKKWAESISQSVKDKSRSLFLALDSENNLLGSVSLKSQNMDNMFPEFKCWLSGLYVDPSKRGRKISAFLIKNLAAAAEELKESNIYLFTHNLKLDRFYEKFGWEPIEPPEGENHFSYREAPILLFKANPRVVFKKANECIIGVLGKEKKDDIYIKSKRKESSSEQSSSSSSSSSSSKPGIVVSRPTQKDLPAAGNPQRLMPGLWSELSNPSFAEPTKAIPESQSTKNLVL